MIMQNMNTALNEDILDVLIIGAGLSGIGAGCYLERELPQKSYAIIEMRDAPGGTWDLFRYPGIRSDSDLYTFSYDFKPWKAEKAIADADTILTYLKEAATEYGVDKKINYHHKMIAANWDSNSLLWNVRVLQTEQDREITIRCRWLFSATGYYNYDEGYTPEFVGMGDFDGDIIHPQHWPEGYDYSGKKVVVIGSGATAVTLIPAMADKTAHITMLQRTPTYIMPVPAVDRFAQRLRRFLPEQWAYNITRRKNALRQRWFWAFCQRYPETARKLIRYTNRKFLPEDFPVDEHFNPPYNPWDQRLCAVPNGDLFKVLSEGRASVVTAKMKRFVKQGIELENGQVLDADVIITATGLKLQVFGGAKIYLDNQEADPTQHIVYKGMMLDNIPNFAFAIGYTNSSWTLKVGLLCQHLCRILSHMDKKGYTVCKPGRPINFMETTPLMDFKAGYVQRAIDQLPRQGNEAPWVMTQNYFADEKLLRKGPVLDPSLHFEAAAPVPMEAAAE